MFDLRGVEELLQGSGRDHCGGDGSWSWQTSGDWQTKKWWFSNHVLNQQNHWFDLTGIIGTPGDSDDHPLDWLRKRRAPAILSSKWGRGSTACGVVWQQKTWSKKIHTCIFIGNMDENDGKKGFGGTLFSDNHIFYAIIFWWWFVFYLFVWTTHHECQETSGFPWFLSPTIHHHQPLNVGWTTK